MTCFRSSSINPEELLSSLILHTDPCQKVISCKVFPVMFLCIKVQKHYHNKNIPNFLFHILILIIILEKKRKEKTILLYLSLFLLYYTNPFRKPPRQKQTKREMLLIFYTFLTCHVRNVIFNNGCVWRNNTEYCSWLPNI